MKKSNLDEMQEQELLKVEHNGCWIAFWGLLGGDCRMGGLPAAEKELIFRRFSGKAPPVCPSARPGRKTKEMQSARSSALDFSRCACNSSTCNDGESRAVKAHRELPGGARQRGVAGLKYTPEHRTESGLAACRLRRVRPIHRPRGCLRAAKPGGTATLCRPDDQNHDRRGVFVSGIMKKELRPCPLPSF